MDPEKLKPGDKAWLKCEKQKDVDRFVPIPITAEPISFKVNGELGDELVSSLVITEYFGGDAGITTPARLPESPPEPQFHKSGVKAWKTLNKLCLAEPVGATHSAWKLATCKTGDVAERSFNNAVKALVDGGWVVKNPANDKLYITAIPGLTDISGGANDTI